MVSYPRAHIYLLSVLEFFLMSVDSLQGKKLQKRTNKCVESCCMVRSVLFLLLFTFVYSCLAENLLKWGLCVFSIFFSSLVHNC